MTSREIERVQIAQHRDVVMPVDALQRVHHDARVARIERGDRLVGEDDLRTLDERPRDRDALLLSAREIVGALRGEAGDVDCSSAENVNALSDQSWSTARKVGVWLRRPNRTWVSTSSLPTRLNCWNIIAARAPARRPTGW